MGALAAWLVGIALLVVLLAIGGGFSRGVVLPVVVVMAISLVASFLYFRQGRR
jgi:hypothetical protein